MQLTPDDLQKHAQRRVKQEIESSRSVIAAYLRGSLLYGSPLLGGVGDIDIVFIHSVSPPVKRALDPLTKTVHFDLEHHDQLVYRDPQTLRTHPWLGPTLHNAQPLHDPRHFIDYTQSGVRSNFQRPENVGRRAGQLLESAREYWLERQLSPARGTTPEIQTFLVALQQAVNGLASLSGPPLPPRRLGYDFLTRLENIHAPDLYPAFIELLGGDHLEADQLYAWLDDWEASVERVDGPPQPHQVHSRINAYYHHAVTALLESDRPFSALWPMLKTWADAASCLADHSPGVEGWENVCRELGFWGERFQSRLTAFDAFLERADQTLRAWAETGGIELL